jgi:hypothetical protein
MSDGLFSQVRIIRRWLNRLRFKSVWREYANDSMTYGEYKERVLKICNDVRRATDVPEYPYAKFDNGWQYLTLASEDYKVAFDAMVNLIYGWW